MFEYIHFTFPERKCSREPIFSEMKSSLKLVALNIFTLHFPIENVLQSNQSSLKWWIHWLFISWTKTFYRVTNLLWNGVFSETRGRFWTIRSTSRPLLASFVFVAIFSYLQLGKRCLFLCCIYVVYIRIHFFRIFSSSWGNVTFLLLFW